MGIKVIGRSKKGTVLYERGLRDDSSVSSINLSFRVAKSIKEVEEVYILQDTSKAGCSLDQADWEKLSKRYRYVQLNTDGTFSLMGITESGKHHELWRMTGDCLQVFQRYIKQELNVIGKKGDDKDLRFEKS